MIWIGNHLYDGLVRLDSNLNVIPGIAKSWTVEDSGKKYIFRLRSDVFFHENEAFGKNRTRRVVAEDFAYSLSRLIDDELASPGAWVLNQVNHFYAADDSTLVIELNQPFPPFLGMLSMAYCSVVPFELAEENNFGRSPVGTGPFHFKAWKEGVKLVLNKNPRYFLFKDGQRLPFLDGVSVSFIPDKQAAFLDFLTGNIDFISGLDASYKDELLDAQGELRGKYREEFKLLTSPYLNTEYLGFSMETPPMGMDSTSYRYLRKAINHGFDRKSMMKYLRNNIGIPAEHGFVPLGLPMPVREPVLRYSPERVAAYLDSAGYPGGEGLPELKLYTNASYLDLCEYIQSSLAEQGINMQVEVNPPSTLREMMSTGKAPMFRGSWIADYPDPENYLALAYGPNRAPEGPNYTRFQNQHYDDLYRTSLSITNDSIRGRMYWKMDSLLSEESPIIPLYYDEAVRFTRKNIKGLEPNPLNMLDLRRVMKE